MEYSMHPDFYEGYIRGYFDMTDFEGKFRKASLEEFFAVSKSIECEEQPCCPIDPTGGGPTPNPSPTPSQPPANPGAPTIIVPINPPNGGGGGVDGSGTLDFIDYDTDCPWVLFCIDCTCINKCHPKTCDCGDARPNNTNFIKSRWVLANPCPDPFTSDDLLTKTSGDCCPSDNDEIPVAPPIDSGTVGDEEDGDNSATPISIICHNSLYNYAATLGVSGNSVAVGNLQGIFSCYPDDCQSSCYNYDENGTNSQVQFEACISTVINDHFADCTQWPSKFDDYEDKFGYEFTEQEKAQILIKSGGCGEDTSFDDEVLEVLGIAGQDWFYDEEFWNNPNLTFPEQDAPSYEDFFDAFPKEPDGSWLYGADNIYNIAGGDVLQARISDLTDDNPRTFTNNTCALKVSIALNGCGIEIPELASLNGKPGTLKGADGNYYFLNARSLANWMKKTFPDFETIEDVQLVESEINSRTGIGISLAGEGESPSGHADIFTGERCSVAGSGGQCFGYGTLFFWELD